MYGSCKCHCQRRCHEKKKCCKPECPVKTGSFETLTFELPSDNPATYKLLAKGDPSNPLAFFVHGFPDSADTWKPVMEIISQQGYYCVAPYLRGYFPTTTTTVPPATDTTSLIVTDLITLSGILADPAKANIYVGHDWGAILGEAVVAFTPFYQKYVSLGNILLNPSLGNFFIEGPDFTFEQAKASFYFWMFQITPDTGNFVADFMVQPFNQVENTDLIKNLWKTWEPEGKFPTNVANAEKALLTDASQDDLKTALNYYRNSLLPPVNPPIFVQQKTLVIIGKLDGSLVFAQDPVLLQKAIDLTISTKQGEPVEIDVFKCAGHFPQASFPRKTAKRILDFLSN